MERLCLPALPALHSEDAHWTVQVAQQNTGSYCSHFRHVLLSDSQVLSGSMQFRCAKPFVVLIDCAE